MNTKINPEKLAQLDSIVIDYGSHYSFEEGHCAMEVVAWLADEDHTDIPKCVSPVLGDYVRSLNDQWGDDERQVLKPYLVRMIGTGGDGKEETRRKVVVRHIADIIGPWLRLAGLDAEADALDVDDRLAVAHKIQDARYAALAARKGNYQLIRGMVLGHLETEGISAPDIAIVSTVEATVDAVSVAAHDAAKPLAAALDAASAYSADRVVTIGSAAAGSVYAVDAVDAVGAVGAVTAATDAYNAADAAGGNHWKMRNSAYNAARAYYAANPLPDPKGITDLAASQQGTALDLLDKMIEVDE